MPRLSKNLEHTLTAWIARVGTDRYHAIREVFPGNTPSEHAHRRNCRLLVRKRLLEPELPASDAPSVGRLSTDQLMSQRFRCSS